MMVLNRGETNASHKVLISEQKVVSADAHKIIPDGYRIITLKEVLLHYTTDSDFRAYLSENNKVWIGKMGVESNGFHEICEDLSFSKIGREAYIALPMQFRSYHTAGPERIGAAVHDNGYGYNSLNIDGFLGSTSYKAKVMYVPAKEELKEHIVNVQRG
jgi:hypothetical protein